MKDILHPSLNQGGTTKLARPSSLSRGGGFFYWQHAETAFQLCSRLESILNVPREYASGVFSPAAALEDPFEQAAGQEEGKP